MTEGSRVDARTRTRRIAALVALGLVVAAGLGVHALLPDTDATDIAGDALYAAAAYAAVVLVAPRMPSLAVAAIAAAWCVGVELFQLTGLPLAAGQAFPPAMLLLGTVFDPRDPVVYVVTVAVVFALDASIRRRRARLTARSGLHPDASEPTMD